MSNEHQAACRDCRFWRPLRPDADAGYADDRNYVVTEDGEGLCRRNPPTGQRRDMPAPDEKGPVFAVDAALWAQWPVTNGDLDWCGEFQPRKEPIPL